MARKNLFGHLTEKKFTAVNSGENLPSETDAERKSTAVSPTFGPKNKGAFGAITKSIDQLNEQAQAAKDIEARLREGAVVVALETSLIDSSFIMDRLGHDAEAFAELVAAIRERGQDTPILVRPHPEKNGRFQVVYGHRRLHAAVELGVRVKAVVKDLTDQQHILAQGQENSARANLSFIEKAMFASKLVEHGYDRDLITSALSINKSVVSKMLSVINDIPTSLILDIGAAKNSGRDKWYKLALAMRDEEARTAVLAHSQSDEFASLQSDEKLESVFSQLGSLTGKTKRSPKDARRVTAWRNNDQSLEVSTRPKNKSFVMEFSKSEAHQFGEWISGNLDRLFEEYVEKTKKNQE